MTVERVGIIPSKPLKPNKQIAISLARFRVIIVLSNLQMQKYLSKAIVVMSKQPKGMIVVFKNECNLHRTWLSVSNKNNSI